MNFCICKKLFHFFFAEKLNAANPHICSQIRSYIVKKSQIRVTQKESKAGLTAVNASL
jgi:hypothetical protein